MNAGMPRRAGTALVLALLMTCAVTAHAYWSQAPTVLFGGAGDQWQMASCSDGVGGVFGFLVDSPYTSPATRSIYRVDCTGRLLWSQARVGNAAEQNSVWWAELAPDGEGGAYLGLLIQNPTPKILLQRWTATGSKSWPGDGTVLDLGPVYTGYKFVLASDALGNVFVGWGAYVDGQWTRMVQRVSAVGGVAWSTDGVAVAPSNPNGYLPAIEPDGTGGLFVAVEGSPLAVQHFDAQGGARWTAPVPDDRPFVHDLRRISPDGAGGLWVAGLRNSTPNTLRAWHFDSQGRNLHDWFEGVHLSNGYPGSSGYYDFLPDHVGGFYAAWREDTPTPRLMVQHVTVANEAAWGAGGAPIGSAPTRFENVRLVEGGGGVAVQVVKLEDDTPRGILVRTLDAHGPTPGEHPFLIVMQSADSDSDLFRLDRIVPTCDGSWTALYHDHQAFPVQSGRRIDVYGQRMDADGRHGVNEPVILSVRDVPGDAGGFVDVTWRTSDLRLDPTVTGLAYDVLRAPAREGPWSAVATGLTPGGASDSLRVPTFADSSGSCACRTYLRVEARADGGLFRGSATDSGASIPGPDTTLAAPGPAAPRLALRIAPIPARNSCTVRFTLAAPADVRLSVLDAQGRRVRTLRAGPRPAGEHAVTLDLRDDGGRALRPGAWFVRIETGREQRSVRLLVRE